MTEDEQDMIDVEDFVRSRIMAWTSAIALDPATGRIDGRTTKARQSDILMRDLFLNMPDADEIIVADRTPSGIAMLWPEELCGVIEFQLGHIADGQYFEPFSDAQRDLRIEHHEMPDWPEWTSKFAAPATVDDHPAFPEKSAVFKEWDAARATKRAAK